MLDELAAFTAGGKRTRARFLAAGAAVGPDAVGAATGIADSTASSPTTPDRTESAPDAAVIAAATALELFHAAALIHDDLLDRSDTRRGRPSAHRAFEALHAGSGWVGDRPHFGVSAAILAGDLLLMWSDDLLAEACEGVPLERSHRVREEYSRMRTEVTAGQYLDIVEELAWPVVPVEDRSARAIRIATSKSARYSVEAPIALGALLAGADAETVRRLRRVGLPLGLAFQLRDDVLGVFGDSAVTGKPAGDDLREGKRTLLIAEVEARADADVRTFFDERLGQADLTSAEVARMQELIRSTGALDSVEAQIARWVEEGLAALGELELPAPVADLFEALAERSSRRDS